MEYGDLTTLGIAFGLGLLVGLQRQKDNDKMAGVRTFTIISILGVIAGFLNIEYDNPFILPVFGLCLALMLVAANFIRNRNNKELDIGQTTEVAALLMFAIGAYLVLGDRVIGVMMGATLAILLYVKDHLHEFIEDLNQKDLSAIFTLVGISMIILPILPNETYGPYEVLNPRNIWWMVTLIVGISVIGYFIYKFVGKNTGVITNGILGGLISSTATTVSYARKTSNTKNIDKIAAFIITVASLVSMIRILIEVGVVIPEKLAIIAVPIGVEIILMIGIAIGLFYLINKEESDSKMPEPKNPAQFKSALIFGLLYGFILLAVAFTKEQFGENALFIVSIISGLTDVDAITLSLSNLMKGGSLDAGFGWKLILLAALSNLVFKGVMAIILGTKQLTKWISISFGISLATGLIIIWLWPESWHF